MTLIRATLTLFFFSLPLLTLTSAHAAEKADMVVIDKRSSRLYLTQKGQLLKAYSVAFGANPRGHKRQRGDERTPEGDYILDYKNNESKYHLSIRISYPNEADITRAKAQGLDPGDNIFIHGQPNGFGWMGWLNQKTNWTDGCIALKNTDMDEVWNAVDEGTKVRIIGFE